MALKSLDVRGSRDSGEGLILTQSPHDVRLFVEEHIHLRVEKKYSNGEVFTPHELVNKMLDAFPTAVWSNPNMKWLDPACGVGNFPVELFYRLDEGLRRRMPDVRKRRHHIISSMIYMVEIDDRNYESAREIFGDDANIFHGSFLDDGWKKAFGTATRYGVVVGNPPYNQGQTRRGGLPFWTNFITRSLDSLAPGGYICFVHPNGWRKTVKGRESSGDVWSHYRRNGHLVYLNMDSNERYKKQGFPIVDFYLWKQGMDCGDGPGNSKCDTMVDATFGDLRYVGELSLNQLPFIPNYVSPAVIGIIRKLARVPKGDRLNVIHKQAFKASTKDTRVSKRGKNTIRKAHSLAKRNKTRSVSGSMAKTNIPYAFVFDQKTKKYTMAYRSNGRNSADKRDNETNDVFCPKVVMTFKGPKEDGCLYPVFYGQATATSANTMYQCVSSKAEGERLVKYFNSDLVIALMKITQYTDRPNHRNDHYVLNMLPDVAKKGVKRLSLTKAEEDVIKRIAKQGSACRG